LEQPQCRLIQSTFLSQADWHSSGKSSHNCHIFVAKM
jgi:hypothetical protein